MKSAHKVLMLPAQPAPDLPAAGLLADLLVELLAGAAPFSRPSPAGNKVRSRAPLALVIKLHP